MIYAIVVTYNPEQALIDSQFESLVNQVDGVIYVDNASSNATVFPISEKVIILRNQVNEGLGRAQNQGLQKAKEIGVDYILLLDQDSVLSENTVRCLLQELLRYEEREGHVGAIGPIIASAFDNRDAPGVVHLGLTIGTAQIKGTMPVTYNIASGSLIPLTVIDKVGGLEEKLFIDGLDVEWCLRARSYGYRILITDAARLYHRLGEGKKDRVLNHSTFREYYIVRNSIIFLSYRHVPVSYKVRKFFLTIMRVLSSLIRLRLKYFIAGLRGLIDGFKCI